jgi:hypothetical protein
LLELPDLKAMQWVPGTGKEKFKQWYVLIKIILSTKKSIQSYAQPDEVDDLINNVGVCGLLITIDHATVSVLERLIERYQGVP